MSLLDKVGKVAMDALDKAARVADKVQERIGQKPVDLSAEDIPDAESNVSPFVPVEDDDDGPLANADLAAQIFGPGTDPWTGRSLQLLSDHDVDHEFVDLEAEGGTRETVHLFGERARHRLE